MDTYLTGTLGTGKFLNIGNYRFSYINSMAISKTCSNARKIIRKLANAGWDLYAFDILDGEGMEPVDNWTVSKEKNTKSLAVIGADIVDSVDYSLLFFKRTNSMMKNMTTGFRRQGTRKMHLCCVPVEATGEESVVNDIVSYDDEETLEMVEKAIA